jgi:hypothetical protein
VYIYKQSSYASLKSERKSYYSCTTTPNNIPIGAPLLLTNFLHKRIPFLLCLWGINTPAKRMGMRAGRITKHLSSTSRPFADSSRSFPSSSYQKIPAQVYSSLASSACMEMMQATCVAIVKIWKAVVRKSSNTMFNPHLSHQNSKARC